MKALVADIHFDDYPNLSTLTEAGISTRLSDALDCFGWVVSEACNAGCDEMFILGDVFHDRAYLSLTVVNAVCSCFQEMARKLKITALLGNHDCALRTPEITSLLTLSGSVDVVTAPTVVGGFGLVPWRDNPEGLDGVIAVVARDADVLLTHAFMEGPHAHGKGLPLSVLQPDQFKQIFLGDVHDPVVLSPKCRYVGSPWQIDFRDAGRSRGFILYDEKRNKTEYVENRKSPRFYLLDSRTAGSLSSIRRVDFVRIVEPDVELAKKLASSAAERTEWVEAPAVEVDDLAPRFKVGDADTDEVVLRNYVQRHGEVADPGALLSVGLGILAEARLA